VSSISVAPMGTSLGITAKSGLPLAEGSIRALNSWFDPEGRNCTIAAAGTGPMRSGAYQPIRMSDPGANFGWEAIGARPEPEAGFVASVISCPVADAMQRSATTHLRII